MRCVVREGSLPHGNEAWAVVSMRRTSELGPVAGDTLPEGAGEDGVAKTCELLPLGVEGLELLGGHGGVFGGVEAATKVAGHVGEALEQREGKAGFDGEIKRKRDAGLGEAEQAGGRL